MDQGRTEPQQNNTTGIVQIKCGLFPSMPIFVSLHKDVSTSSDPTTMNSPHFIAQRLSNIQHGNSNTDDDDDDDSCGDLLLSSYKSLEEENNNNNNNNHRHQDNSNNNNSNGDVNNHHLGGFLLGNYFALADASRILSLDHLSVAIHTALLRTYRHSIHDTDNLNRNRGKALESIVCAAGSTHVASILKDYAFLLPTPPQSNHPDKKKKKKEEDGDVAHHDDGTTRNRHVLLIGVNVSLDAFRQVLLDKNIGLESVPPEPYEHMTKYFSRERTCEEITALIKSYKTTREEVAMQGLERAILHRVASKFYTS